MNTDHIKQLRSLTGAGIVDCKNALAEADGDLDRAQVILAERGSARAGKLADRPTDVTRVGSYVHSANPQAALVRVGCNTDFVANTESFRAFCDQLAMQAVAVEALSVDELLASAWLTDESLSTEQVRAQLAAQLGENITIMALARI